MHAEGQGDPEFSMNYDYAKAFRIVRATFNLRQADLAPRLSITPSQLSLIEAGKRQPSLRVVNALARAVGMPAALITLLASSVDDVASTPSNDMSDLAKALLRLLVAAKDEPQHSFRLEGGP